MPRDWIKRQTPKLKDSLSHPWLARWHHKIHDPGIWHIHRNSIARGVAIGLFCGFIPGPLQMISAAFMAIVWRGNMAAALIGTWMTNPFTIIPLYAAAAWLGSIILGKSHGGDIKPAPDWVENPAGWWSSLGDWIALLWHWLCSLGPSLAVGLPLLAILTAAFGYFATGWLWRGWVAWRWRRRQNRTN